MHKAALGLITNEPSSAAANGYLRRVTSLRTEGGELVVETTQANLTDAITQGDLTAEGELTAADLATATPMVQGLEVGVRPLASVGDGYEFEASFNETLIDLQQGGVNTSVRVSGTVSFNAGYHVGIGIDGPDLLEGEILPEVATSRLG